MNDEFPPISREEVTTWWNAFVYSACFYLLGIGVVTSLLIFPVVLICTQLNYGGRWAMKAGFGLLVLTVLVTIGLVPEPGKWRELKDSAIMQASSILQERLTARKE